MFERVTLWSSDVEVARLGYAALAGGTLAADLLLNAATAEHQQTTGLHIAFRVLGARAISTAHAAALAAGFLDEGRPGPRPAYGPDYYGGFALDPDGNSVEAAQHDRDCHPGTIDHLWLRVLDLAAARDRFLAQADAAGYELQRDRPDWVLFGAPSGSFSLRTDGPPTRNVRIAFAQGGVVVAL